jgi:hypothetical protein
MKSTRREVLVAVVALAAQSPTEAQVQPAFLPTPELDCLKALVDTIIPRTGTPGASDAGVHTSIDRRLAVTPQLAEPFRAGLRSLDAAAQSRFGAGFAALAPDRRVELLQTRLDDPFFRTAKDLTVDAYYSSKEGLTEELGWHGNTFLTEFKGCTHPEHQR